MCPMPRVSDAHLAARRQQILDAARTCFLRNGFHQTSMQDVIKAAGLSVGAVYRYFPSKYELITAIAEQVIAEVISTFEALAAVEPPPPLGVVMQRAVGVATQHSGPDGALRLAVQVWSESLHDPVLAEFIAGVYRRIRDTIGLITKRAQEAGELPADADADAVSSVLFALMPGYALLRILIGEPEPEVFTAGLRALLPGSPARVARGE